MRLQLSCFLLFCFVWLSLFTLLPASAGAESGTDPCELFTRADAEALLAETVSDGRSKSSSAPAGKSCSYFFDKNGGSYSVSVRICETSAIEEEGIFDSAQDVFSRQKRALEASAYAQEKFRTVPGVGDEAFWNGTDLWCLKGERLVVIKVNPVVEGAYKNMDELDAAKVEKSLDLSKQAAAILLQRID